ncbi:hypothetical protein RJZ56_002824 [Blastomyces dermatitidis]
MVDGLSGWKIAKGKRAIHSELESVGITLIKGRTWNATYSLGLSLSLALQKVNIPCTVYEERAESYETGGGITLSPNILDELGVYDRVRDKGYHFDTLAFSDNDGAIKDVYYFGSEKLYGYRGFRIMCQSLINEMKLMLREYGI